MDKDAFGKYLEARNANEAQIEGSFKIVEKLENFCKKSRQADTDAPITADDFTAFSAQMIAQGENSFDNYLALARYGRFLHNHELFVAALDMLDGAEAFDNLFKKVGDAIGDEARDKMFASIEIPVLGTANPQKVTAMQAALEAMDGTMSEEDCIDILASGLRDLPDAYYQNEKSKYEECKDIDAYLRRKGDDFIAELTKIKEENGLFFNQEITDEVIAFVESVPEIRQGVRVGNIIYETKIPHQAKEFLAETDPDKKRFYYCHCPWAKVSLKDGPSSMPSRFCNCSAAFHKKPYEVIFGQPLKAEVLESVLQGDMWCRFAIHLPEGVVK